MKKQKHIKVEKAGWKMWIGGALILFAIAFFVIYTRELGEAMIGWTNHEVNGVIFRQGIWAMFSVYTEIILEALLISLGVQLIRDKKIARWMLICFAIFFAILICGHITYFVLAQ